MADSVAFALPTLPSSGRFTVTSSELVTLINDAQAALRTV